MRSKQYAKKLLSLIIASVMIVTMLPVSALAAGADDVMIEDQAETIVEEAADVSGEVVEEAAEVPDIEDSEDAAIVEGAVDELEEADPEELTGYTENLSCTAQGVPSGSNMCFDAELTGLTVSAVVPAKRAAKGSVMTADIVNVSAYEDAIAKKNYGKSIAGLYGLELHFYDKKGKEIKHINTSDVTVTIDGFEASSYFIGRIDNKVKKIQRGTEPTFKFTEKKAYTYVIAGLEDDGLVRASGEADGDGNKRFNLNDENVDIEIVAPEDAFADGVAMEASDVTNGTTLGAEDGGDALVGASSDEVVAAYEISFYNEEGDEQQPSKEVTVTINMPLDMTQGYELIHIADDGTRSGVDGAQFSENGVTFTADSFSVYAVVKSEITSGKQYIIYTQAGGNYYALTNDAVGTVQIQVNGNNVTSSGNNVFWTATASEYGYIFKNGDNYLRRQQRNNDDVQINTTNSNNVWIPVKNGNGYRLHCIVGTGNNTSDRYLRRNGNTVEVSSQNNASTFYFAEVTRIEEPAPTIHLGYLDDDNAFQEFTNGSFSANEITGNSLIFKTDPLVTEKIPSGYSFIGARYNDQADTTSTLHEVVEHKDDNDNVSDIRKDGNQWKADITSADWSGARQVDTNKVLSNTGHIYVFYEPTGTDGYKPPTSGTSSVEPEEVAPHFKKTVTENTDGTYTIKLDIEGHQAHVQTGQGANVIVVIDNTTSMKYNMSGSQKNNVPEQDQRITAAKAALHTLAAALYPENSNNTIVVNTAFIEFNNSATTRSWMTSKNDINNYIDDTLEIPEGHGTNWEAGLRACNTLLDTIPNNNNLKNNKTYVIFMTDGDTNRCVECQLNNDINYEYSAQAAAHAQDDANAIATKSYLYGVFCGSSAGGDRLRNLIDAASGKETHEAADATALNNTFKGIGELIARNIGSSEVGIDDGLPSLASIQQNVSGTATDFTYYKDGELWTGSEVPQATYDSTNGVVWDLSSVDTLEEVTYSVAFKIWPKQASYDLIADLNNGLKVYEAGNPKSITQEERDQVEKDPVTGLYTLKTNTHLKATYYNEADGQTYTPDNIGYEGKHMPLPAKAVSIQKLWPANLLDPQNYGTAAYRDPETGEIKTATEIELTLQRIDNGVRENYFSFTVTSADEWQKDDVFLSCGFMTVDSNGVVDIKEPGHDYQITEPPAFMYFWDLLSDVYHPMVINGVSHILVYDPAITAADVAHGIYEIPAASNRFYKTQDVTPANTLKGYNYRRSNLNLTKEVFSADGKTKITDENAVFEYKVTVNNSNTVDQDIWFSAWDPKGGAGGTGAFVTDEWVTGQGVESTQDENGNEGYFKAPNGTELTMKIKAGWNVRFLNLYHDSTFSIEETGMPNNYEFSKVEGTAKNSFMVAGNANWYTPDSVNGKKVTGKITEPNNEYTITYSNKTKPEFYIYHSSVEGDGDLETIPFPKAGEQSEAGWSADGKTYNLYSKTKTGTLYGGYYLDYAGKGSYKDDGIKATGGVAYTGMNYDWSGAQTVNGTAITPVGGETYYIKEVPIYYLRNYYQVTYLKSDFVLKSLYLISAIDDLNYKEAGLVITTTKDDNKESIIVQTMTYKNYTTGASTTLKANNVFRRVDGTTAIDKDGEWLTYFEASANDCFKPGTFTVCPYWITLDDISVKGISNRIITIPEDMKQTGMQRQDVNRQS